MIRLKSLLFEEMYPTGSNPDISQGIAGDAVVDTEPAKYELIFKGWEDRALPAAKYLINKYGMDPKIAAGFIGNFSTESGVRSNISQYYTKGLKLGFGFMPTTLKNAKEPDWAGYGIAQWTRGRKQKLIAAGADTVNKQLDFMMSELEGSYSSAWETIQGSKSVADATTNIVVHYEQAGKPKTDKRIKHATTIYNLLTSDIEDEDPKSTDFKIYIVKSGDSISKIASKEPIGITANTIADLNKIAVNSTLKIGQKLKIPIISK